MNSLLSRLYALSAPIKNHVTYTPQPHQHRTSTFKFTVMHRSMSYEGVWSDYVARILSAHRKWKHHWCCKVICISPLMTFLYSINKTVFTPPQSFLISFPLALVQFIQQCANYNFMPTVDLVRADIRMAHFAGFFPSHKPLSNHKSRQLSLKTRDCEIITFSCVPSLSN